MPKHQSEHAVEIITRKKERESVCMYVKKNWLRNTGSMFSGVSRKRPILRYDMAEVKFSWALCFWCRIYCCCWWLLPVLMCLVRIILKNIQEKINKSCAKTKAEKNRKKVLVCFFPFDWNVACVSSTHHEMRRRTRNDLTSQQPPTHR